jgi:hypothetical protein
MQTLRSVHKTSAALVVVDRLPRKSSLLMLYFDVYGPGTTLTMETGPRVRAAAACLGIGYCHTGIA